MTSRELLLILVHGIERLLLLFFGVARGIFILQGIAFGCASVAALAGVSPEAPAWLRSAMISVLLLSGTFFLAGLLLIAARRWRVTHARGGSEARFWPLLLGFSLLTLPAVAAIAASGLLPLWNRIATQLATIGSWDDWAQPGPSGLVIIPILLALFVPTLVTAAAFLSVAFPLTLVPLLVTRSQLFPTLLAMGGICQAALVFTGWIATDTLARLAEQAFEAMAASGDAEVLLVADEMVRATGILTRTTIALVAPMLGILAWLAFLRPSGAAAAFFTEGTNPAPDEALHTMLVELAVLRSSIPISERQAVSNSDVAAAAPEPGAGTRRIRLALAVLGALMLLFAAADGLRSRPSYLSSQPAPGARLSDPPTIVRVTFGAALDPASSLSIVRLVVQSSAGEEPREIQIVRRLAPDDPKRRTIEAVLPRLSAGLYRVTWQALPAWGGVPRHGSFSFGVGVSVPSDSPGITHSLQDRDAGARGRRSTVVGGMLLLLLGAMLSRRSPRA